MSLHHVCQCNHLALSELLIVLNTIQDRDYSLPTLSPSSNPIGIHVRHIIEFYQAFFYGLKQGTINYDHRPRDSLIEQNRHIAQHELHQLQQQLVTLATSDSCPATLSLTARVNASGLEVNTPSGVIRELLFLLNHSVHHMALIRLLLEQSGHTLPDNFGVATATQIHRAFQAT